MLFPRVSEWISIVAFAALMVLAWQRNLNRVRQAKVAGLGAAAIGVTVFASMILPLAVPPATASVVRDSVPCLLLLLFYSQAGQFVTGADFELEKRLERLDQRWLCRPLEWCSGRRIGVWILTCLEAAYFYYYVSIPLSVGVLYWLGKQRDADYFWTVVLVAAYGSCGMLPFIQTRPPRMLGEKWSVCLPSGNVRTLNLWILRHGSIQANTIPSAHVAIATASALALLEIAPLWVGLSFLGAAIGVALGAVAGRYHYAVDVILGFALAAAAFLAVTAAW